MISKSKASLIIEDFESKIRSGQLKKGDRLPNETDYANQLGVSRVPLREAIKILQRMGAVSQKPKVGTVIICDNPNLWIRQPSEEAIKNSNTFRHLIAARLIIEPPIMQMCVERIDSQMLKDLHNLVDEIIRISAHLETNADYEQYVDCVILFHMNILIATGNPFLIQTYPVILKTTKELLLKLLYTTPCYVQNSNKMLHLICEAIEKTDYDKASMLMNSYILLDTEMLFVE